MSTPVATVHTGTNAELIAEVWRLYGRPGAVVLDVTYGTGRFWRNVPGTPSRSGARRLAVPSSPRLTGSDILPGTGVQVVADFRQLPYRDGCADIVVLDPPYAHNAGTRNPHDYGPTTTRYNGHTTAPLYNADIMGLYRDGMAEAYRVLRPEGSQLWVKCKDEVEREVQRWSHIRIYEMALELGFCARDLFILAGTTSPQRWPGRRQWHARKNHSYLWVFERPDARYRKLLSRPAPVRNTWHGRC